MSTTIENVKISIKEDDQTSPYIYTLDTTDIAYVPGKSTNTDAPKKPMLVTTVKEFETIFGDSKVTDDLGHEYAKRLLSAGMPVVYYAVPESATSRFPDELLDKNEYTIKYITNGGESVVTCALGSEPAPEIKVLTAMVDIAAKRGDCVALIDVEHDDETSITPKEVYEALNNTLVTEYGTNFKDLSYAAAFYGIHTYSQSFECGGSLAYLLCLAKAVKTSPNWLAIAGTSRGVVPDKAFKSKYPVTNTVAEYMQPKKGSTNNQVSINCITDIRPYGSTIWGNRTLLPLAIDKGTQATSFLNTRNMISDIKKLLYATSTSLMFEQNTDTLWLRFKSSVSPLLEQLKMGGGISGYKIIKNTQDTEGKPLPKNQISATLRIYPVYAVEYFDLTVEISDEDVALS